MVELLYNEGYLSKRGKAYCANRSTESALRDHDIDVEELSVKEVKKATKKPSAEQLLAEHINLTSSLEQVTQSRDAIQQSLLKYAINEAKAGDPWNFVRRQWPELIITDPIDLEYFKRNCSRDHALDLRLDDVQVELIEHGLNPTIPEIAIKGSTSPGKGFATALLVNIRYHIFPDRIVLISQSSKHAKDVMFAEVVTWRKKMRYPDDCETQVAGVIDHNNPKHFIGIANPETGEGLSGGHGKHVMFIFDESSCHDDQTEILTRSGWKLFKDLHEGEPVFVMDRDTKNSYYEVPEKIIACDYCGEMITCKTRSMNFCVTPNHRMLVHRTVSIPGCKAKHTDPVIVPADEACFDNQGHLMYKVSKWIGEESSDYAIPAAEGPRKNWPEIRVDMDDWLKFLGIFASDGSFGRVKSLPYTVIITQKKEEQKRKIKRLLDRLPFLFSTDVHDGGKIVWRTNSKQLGDHLESLLGPNKANRVFPEFIERLSARQIKLFVDWYAMGDGSLKKSGRSCVYTQLKSTADYIQILALKAGYNCSVSKRSLAGQEATLKDGRIIKSKKDGYVASIMPPKQGYYSKNTTREHYEGKVYCVTMPKTDIVLTRREGRVLWSGNSTPSELPINARKQASLIVYISNPRTLSGFFYDLYPKVEPDKNQVIIDKGIKRACMTFGGKGALNVRARRLHLPYGPPGGYHGTTLDGEEFFVAEGDTIPDEYWPHVRALIPGQMDLKKYDTIMQTPDETERRWSGEGKFPLEDAEFQIIVPTWLEKPCAMWREHKDKIEITALGLDLAASVKGDSTILVAGGPLGIKHIFKTQKSDSMETLSWVVSCCQEMGIDLKKGDIPIAIDAIGAGGGMMASLMEMNGAVVYAMKGNRAAENSALYCNVRAELYGVLGERLNPDSAHLDVFMIPDDDELKEELTAHEKHFVADMTRFYCTPKVRAKGQFANVQTIKERIGRSPDIADAVTLCHWVIRDREFDGSVAQQFNPNDVLEQYQKKDNGRITEVRGNGNLLDVTEEQFSQNWGNEPTSIEDEIAAFRAAAASFRGL